MQHLNGLRSLRVLHILFVQSDYCAGILREIRYCAIDSIIRCPSLQIEYIAVSYALNGPAGTSISRLEYNPSWHSARSKTNKRMSDSRLDEDRDRNEEANGSGGSFDWHSPFTGRHTSGALKGKGKEAHFSWMANGSDGEDSYDEDDDGDDEEEEWHGKVTVHDGVKFRDITGVKVWQKEMWDLRL